MTVSPLQHVSFFSGVGGIDLAFARAGVPTVSACEIDRSARGVLADRFPSTHLFHDITKVTADDLLELGLDPGRTVLSGGFPCQDVSVAGGRRGMGEGTRSGLYWHLDRLMVDFAPRWVVFENVPGLMSATCACPGDGSCTRRGLAHACPGGGASHAVPGGLCGGECVTRHGGVMGAVLGSMAVRGYGFAYRVLDAQHFGVPQRRRRVVIVGRLGDTGAAPAEVLLEPEGLPWDLEARLPQGSHAPAGARGSAGEGGVVGALTAHHGRLDDNQATQLVVGVLGEKAHTLTAEGHDASEDGTGRGTPIVTYAPETAATLTAGTSSPGVNAPGRRQEDDHNVIAFHHQQDPTAHHDVSPTLGAGADGMGIAYHEETVGSLQAGPHGQRLDADSAAAGHFVAYAADKVGTIDTRQGGADVKEAQDGRLVATFQKTTRPASSDHPDIWQERDVAATLSPYDLGSDTRAVELVVEDEEQVLAPTLTASLGEGGWAGHNRKDEMVERTFQAGATVRRLTPVECERLQGFPDGHTRTASGKDQADSQRYKQMGNAVAVPVFEWVARRLVAVDARIEEEK